MINYRSPLTEEFITTGKSASCPIIDTHAHMFDCYECNMLVNTPDRQLEYMDRSGVALAMFCGHDALFGGRAFLDEDLSVCKRWPDRYRMYMDVYSSEPDPKKDLAFAEKNPEVIGMKFHAIYGVHYSDPCHDEYFRYADERKLPVLFHTWNGSSVCGPADVERVLEKWHDVKIIAGHSFRGSFTEGIRLAKKYPNLYLELTAVLSQRGMVDGFVAAGLADRIVFGVDAPWFSYDFGVGALLSAEMDDETRRKILYRNAARILCEADADIPAYVRTMADN